jgi:DNA-binding GntR family transcriptional regulator
MLQLHDDLYDQTFRYRCYVMNQEARLKTVSHEHAMIAELVMKRQTDAACEALTAHLASLLAVSI